METLSLSHIASSARGAHVATEACEQAAILRANATGQLLWTTCYSDTGWVPLWRLRIWGKRMQDEPTGTRLERPIDQRNRADAESQLDALDAPVHILPRRFRLRVLVPQGRAYTVFMLVLLAVGVVCGLGSGSAMGLIVAGVLLAFVFLPVALVVALERRRPPEP
jgi:hypothetical protein